MAADGRAPPPFRPGWRARLGARLASALGGRRIKPLLAALKVRGLSIYSAPTPSGPTLPQSLADVGCRSEEHTSERQSLMRSSYAPVCFKKSIMTSLLDKTH